jgi:hypothetical protein
VFDPYAWMTDEQRADACRVCGHHSASIGQGLMLGMV